MKKSHAKIIAKTIKYEHLLKMLDNAREQISDWKKGSVVNKSATIGTTWNILTPYAYNQYGNSYLLEYYTKVNLIREFGEYLPEEVKIIEHKDPEFDFTLVHQEPVFIIKDNK